LKLTDPVPFAEAVDRLEKKSPVASALRSEDWSRVPLETREAAFFSAGVTELRTLVDMQDILDEALTLNPADAFADRSRFVADMRKNLGAAPGDSKRLTDITSHRRLELIYDFQMQDAYSYGRWQAGQTPELLEGFPAQELIRNESRHEERKWTSRWQANGGTLYGGRMIALVDAPIWTAISRFGRPWPPFDFGSGMGVQRVSRREALRLGVISAGDPAPKPPAKAFNAEREASVKGLTPSSLNQLGHAYGDQLKMSAGKARLDEATFDALIDEAIKNPKPKGAMKFGQATPRAIALTAPHGIDLTGAELNLSAAEIRHILKVHGPTDLIAPGSGEKRKGQLPIQPHEIKQLVHVWRAPDEVHLSPNPKGKTKKPVLHFRRKDFGNLWGVVWEQHPEKQGWILQTAYKGTTEMIDGK
jgi:hypothetical protein